jgi:chemotaxis protein CheD
MINKNPKRIHLIQGEYKVSDDPEVVFTTLLGSCVAACMRDPIAKVGGINHFLLPGDMDRPIQSQTERYNVHLMELLINGLLQRGAQRHRLQAKLFGGAGTVESLTDIGARNVEFAERFIHTEKIELAGGSLRGSKGRRIEFWPVSGRARQYFLRSDETVAVSSMSILPQASLEGVVELF